MLIYRPFQNDLSTYCTSFIGTVLSSIIVSMEEDGTLQNIYRTNIAKKASQSCNLVPEIVLPDDGSLSLLQAAGVFIFYIGVAMLSLIFLLYRWFRWNGGKPKASARVPMKIKMKGKNGGVDKIPSPSDRLNES